MAVTAVELANLPELLPRGPKSELDEILSRPSAGLTTR